MDYKKYAKILFLTSKEKSQEEYEKFLNNFFLFIKNKRQEKLLSQIYSEVEKLIDQDKKENKTTLIVKDKNKINEIIEKIQNFDQYFETENIEIKENKNIIGGFIAKNQKYILDNSYSTKLLKLYNKIIS